MAGQTNEDMLDAALAELGEPSESTVGRSAADAAAAAAAQADKFEGDEDTEAAVGTLLNKLADPDFQAALDGAMAGMKDGKPADNRGGATADLAANVDGDELDATLKQTMEMMGRLGTNPDSQESAAAMSDEAMQAMMKEYEEMGKRPDFQQAIDNVMKQLLTKDIMAEPVAEITQRFPVWLADNRGKLSAEEYSNYGSMYQTFQRLHNVYETEPDNFPRIMEYMQDLQECGQPPADIIKDLAPGLDFGPDGMPMLPNMGQGLPGMPHLPTGACSIM